MAVEETNRCDIVIYRSGICRNEYGGYGGQVRGINLNGNGQWPSGTAEHPQRRQHWCDFYGEETRLSGNTLSHVDIRYRFVNDMILAKELMVEHIRSGENPSDAMTKNLPLALFGKHASIISDGLLGTLYDPPNTEDVNSNCATVDVPNATVPCGQCSDYNTTLATCSVDCGSEVGSNVGWTTIHSKSRRGKSNGQVMEDQRTFPSCYI